MTTIMHRAETTLLEQFLDDPRTKRLVECHTTSIHVAVLVRRGQVITHAHNRIGSRSRGSGYSQQTIHAERNVIKSLGDISLLRGADMYVMRFSKDSHKVGHDRFMSSKPCSSCQIFLAKCMKEYGLKNVYYTS
jgi:hypothetical protein